MLPYRTAVSYEFLVRDAAFELILLCYAISLFEERADVIEIDNPQQDH